MTLAAGPLEPTDHSIGQVNNLDCPQQEKQCCEDNIQSRPQPEPHLDGVDIERGLAEPKRGEHHHRATQHDQHQSGDVADNVTPLRQSWYGERRARDPENRSNFWNRKPNAMIVIAVRTQARNVRSFVAWSLYGSIIG
jgi:hypothetical protein